MPGGPLCATGRLLGAAEIGPRAAVRPAQHELERQRLEYKEGAEKQLKRDVLAVKRYYEEKMEKVRPLPRKDRDGRRARAHLVVVLG